MLRALTAAKGVFLAASVFLLCLTLALHWVTFDLDFYESKYEWLAVPESLQVDMPTLMGYTTALLDYLAGRRDTPNVETTVRGRMGPLYGERELLHLVDVRVLYALSWRIRNIALIAALSLSFAAYRTRSLKRVLSAYVATTAAIVLGLLGLTGLAVLDFPRYFTWFHLISFDNDLWLLDPATENLINMFPEAFFAAAALRIAITAVVAFTLLGIVARQASKRLPPMSRGSLKP
ncbi:MAG: hypothetical protein DDT37_01405 [Firmicutes bacterium]|nr:hypothetical protein [candidate division NPL-UPA2 bacterium]